MNRSVSSSLVIVASLAMGVVASGLEADRYFIVLAGRNGTFYDLSGPTFAMVISAAGAHAQIEAVGIHAAGHQPVFGAVPASTYAQFMKEPRNPSDVLLRMEVTGAQHERSLRILRTWERRAREGALLYPDVFMNNILFLKQITEDLGQNDEAIALYNLDWGLEDDISENNRPPNIPFLYVKELRRLNGSRHVRDADMPKALLSAEAVHRKTVP